MGKAKVTSLEKSNPAKMEEVGWDFDESVKVYNRLLETAGVIFERDGHNSLSLENVSIWANIPMDTVLDYFRSNDALVEGFLRKEFFKIVRFAQEKISLDKNMSSEEILKQFFEILLSDERFIKFKPMFLELPFIAGSQTGLSILGLLKDQLSKALCEVLNLKFAPGEIDRKIFILLHSMRGLLAVEFSHDVSGYSAWMAKFALVILEDSRV